jgi:glycosyltransferase involved in cell wall biosynthesis
VQQLKSTSSLRVSAASRTLPARALRAGASTPLRVCFVIDELAPAGTETQLLALIRHLDRRRIWPYLCLLRGDKPMSQALEPDDCPILRLDVASLHHPRTLLRAGRFLRFLRRERIDVVQAYFADSSYFAIPLAWLAGVPHRIRTRNNLGHWLTKWHRRWGRLLNVFTTQTIANCEAARQALLAAEQPRPDSVVVLPNGVDLERFRDVPPLSAQLPEEPRIGVLANLRPIKGLNDFVRAAARIHVRHPRAHFMVAGEGELRSELLRQAAEMGLADRFTLPGSIADVPGLLASLDVAVLCSHAEGLSNALLEYAAASRPIVATAVGAAPELIVDGVHGLLVPPRDAERLAESIERLLDDRGLAQRLGAAARRRAWERHGREAMVRRFTDFYEGLRHDASTSVPIR